MEKTDGSSNPKRRYDASRRQAEAQDRQRRVVLAATELFLERGYGATSIDQIAREAGVSSQSVYATFESKAGILERAMHLARTGDEQGSLRRSKEAAAIVAERDVPTRCRMVARLLRRSYEPSVRLIVMVERASATDPALAELMARMRVSRRESVRALLESVPASSFRPPYRQRERTLDVLATIADGRTYSELVDGLGWTPDRYETWLADTMQQLLFAAEPT